MESESIGGLILAKMAKILHEYFIETYTRLADDFYTIAALLVTLYIVIMGYLALKGKVGDSIGNVLILVFSVPITFGIFFHITVFENWIYQPILSTMLGLMGIGLGGDTFTLISIFQPIDESFVKIFEAVDRITNQMDTWDLGMKVKVFTVSALLGLVYGALYVIFTVLIIGAVFSIHVLVILGPIFGTLAAFKPTRGHFFAWLKAIITYALIPVFTAIVMGITLNFLDNAIADISTINIAEDGIFTASIGSALFIGIMSITLHMKAPEFANSITGGQTSGLSGFFGTAGAVGFAGAQIAGAAGGNKLLNAGRSGLAAAGKGIQSGAAGMAKNAYSKLRGFGK